MKGGALMATEPVTLELDEEAARVVKDASPERRRALETLVSLYLLEVAAPQMSLRDLMDAVSQQAQARGLTEERLQEILREAHEARRAE
jgi:hypothetical protein